MGLFLKFKALALNYKCVSVLVHQTSIMQIRTCTRLILTTAKQYILHCRNQLKWVEELWLLWKVLPGIHVCLIIQSTISNLDVLHRNDLAWHWNHVWVCIMWQWWLCCYYFVYLAFMMVFRNADGIVIIKTLIATVMLILSSFARKSDLEESRVMGTNIL